MPPADSVQPVFYLMFGAFMALAALHLWRSLGRRLSNKPASAQAKAFTVHLID
jgi:hypothetical protein